MKQHFRNAALCIAALAVFLLTVCGCHAMYPVTVTIPDAATCPLAVDILLPMEENDPNFLDVSYDSFSALDMSEEEVRQTALYSYKTDGYRSMLVHYPLSDYRIEEKNDGSCEVHFYLNGKQEFEKLIARYGTFKLAAVDAKGNILYVSEPYQTQLRENVYLDGITFDVGAETVTPHYYYDRPFWLELLEVVAKCAIPLMPVASLAGFVFVVILRVREGRKFPNLWFALGFGVAMLPLVGYFACRLDYALKTQSPLGSIWTDFTSLGEPLMIAYDLIPAFLLVIVFAWAAYLTNLAHTDTAEEPDV